MSSNCPDKRDQRGATLVMALLVVLVVVALATRLGRDFFVLQRMLEYQNEREQARAWLRGAESVARQALLLDVQSGSKTDSPLEAWAQVQRLPLADGVMTVCLDDLQGRLNLNDLGTPQSEGLSAAQRRFIRLLQLVQPEHPLDASAATAVANAVFDWIDADNQPRNPGGAEELDYLQLGRDYRPANQGFTSVAELQLVAGVDAALVAALTPFVSVWGNGSLNVNTADAALLWTSDAAASDKPAEPVLLRTLGSADSLRPLSVEAAQAIANERSRKGGVLPDTAVFRQAPLALVPWELAGLGVASDYFRMTADMLIATHHHRLQTVLARTADAAGRPQVVVKSRTWETGTMTTGDDCAVARH